MTKLNDKQRLFVAEYIVDFNGAAAARRAGYAEKTARITAAKLLTKANVQESIQTAIESRLKALDVTADRVLQELARIGFSDMRDYTAWGPRGVRLKDYSELSEDAARAVSEVSQTITLNGGSLKFKLHDKKAALELLGKHLGLFEGSTDDLPKLIDTFLAGAETMRGMSEGVRDLSEG